MQLSGRDNYLIVLDDYRNNFLSLRIIFGISTAHITQTLILKSPGLRPCFTIDRKNFAKSILLLLEMVSMLLGRLAFIGIKGNQIFLPLMHLLEEREQHINSRLSAIRY